MGFSFYALIFTIGLVVGSFFNVVIFRFNSGSSVIKGRSNCLNCKTQIRWFDLIPIISYFALRGRCRNCHARISTLYPIVELTTAVTLLMVFLKTGEFYLLVLSGSISLLFLLIIFIDIRYFVIPDKILILLIIATVIAKFANNNWSFFNLLISSFGLTSFFAILFLVSKGRWIGLGDIKLIFIICLLFGYPLSYIVLVSSVWTASLFSLILLVSKKANLKTKIPFGAFLSVVSIIFLIFDHGFQEISKYFY